MTAMYLLNTMNSVNASCHTGNCRPGPEMSTGMSLRELKYELENLTDEQLNATSCITYIGFGSEREYTGLYICGDNSERPRMPHEVLPMNNRALLKTTKNLMNAYGLKSYNMELAFLKGGMNPPGFTQVTLLGTGLGLYFNVRTGEPMGKLDGQLP